MKRSLIWLLPLVALAACKEDTAAMELPTPQSLTEEAAGYYCQMVILEHQGPKAQAFLAGAPAPLWFSQVRDGVAYLKSPEQEAEIIVIYVNDMAKAVSWTDPGENNWIKAQDAFYVVGSDAIGGMGAPELAPFGDIQSAQQFAKDHGGSIMKLDEIPAEVVLAPVEFETANSEIAE